ncbi:MAG TPA: hypothetical protein VHH36_09530, partial [Candidatus Thermoplasmatota archaeon]|nr:hypothetical protein [Candidatus Thermoplasmatota archaeon]
PPILRMLLKVLLGVGMTVAAPFFAAGILFLLLEWSLPWILVPTGIGLSIVLLAFVGWLMVRAKLRAFRRALSAAATWEAAATAEPAEPGAWP